MLEALTNNPKKTNRRTLFYLVTILFAYFTCSSIALTAQYQTQESLQNVGAQNKKPLPLSKNQSYIPHIQYFTTTDGLSHREVLFIFHARDGITWISTPNGLNRFDGYHFQHFLGKKNGIDLRNIGRITQDDEGWLWLISGQEVIFLNPQTEQFQTVIERFGADCVLLKSKRPTSNLADFQVDNEGRIYFVSDDTHIIYTYHSSEGFKKLILPFCLKYVYLTGVSDNKELTLLLGDIRKVYDYNYGVEKLIFSPITDSTYTLKEEACRFSQFDIRENQKGDRWRSDFDNFYFFDDEGNFLTVSEGYRTTEDETIFLDQQGKYWISTRSGFYIISIKENNFNFLAKPTFLKLFDPKGLLVDSTKLTIALEQFGITTYDFHTQQWKEIKETDWSRGIYTTKEGTWIVGWTKIQFLKNDVLKSFPYYKDVIGDYINFWSISSSQLFKNRLWLGAANGLYHFNTQTKQFKQYKNQAIKNNAYLIKAILPDSKKQHWLWLCTDQGLLLFDEQKEAFIAHYGIDQSNDYFLPAQDFQHFYQETASIYWLATADAGIIRWDKDKNEYQQFGIKDGLASPAIHAIYPDDFGNLWMSSDYGIMRMNKKTFAIKHFSPKDGTGQTTFNRMSHFNYQDQFGNQNLFFGGLEGITSFHPKDFQEETQPIAPFLALLNYQQFDGQLKEVVNHTLSLKTNKQIILQSNDYIHQLEVGLLNYNDVANNIYQYQLKRNGQPSDWQTQKSRNIQVGQLPYGEHQLTIKANTVSNNPSANELVFDIIVLRPFYLTWWGISLFLSVVGGLLYWQYRVQLNRQLTLQETGKLKELDVAKTRLYTNITHEFRTPLTVILGMTKQLETYFQGIKGNKEQGIVATIDRNSHQLLGLINQMLDLSKLESKTMPLHMKQGDIVSYLKYLFQSFESLAETKDIKMYFLQEIESCIMDFDPEKIRILLSNLLSNAIKYNDAGGAVTLTLQQTKAQYLRIAVKDTGIGISKENLPYIFDRFYQTDSSASRGAEGTGIGLALTKELVELLSGSINVTSTIHEETCFAVLLPITKNAQPIENSSLLEEQIDNNQEKATKQTIESLSSNDHSNTEQYKVLIVEDNADVAMYLKSCLETAYQLYFAQNGQEGIDQALQLIPDIIISDVMMPLKDGFELCQTLKKAEETSHIPIILLTAKATIEDKIAGLEYGADAYLTKPFYPKELAVRLEKLIENRKRLQAKYSQGTLIATPAPKTEEVFLQKLQAIILEHLDETNWSSNDLPLAIGISRTQLHLKIKALTGVSTAKYINKIRLQEAVKLLRTSELTIAEIAYSVGYSSPEYFARVFSKAFGQSPTSFRAQQ